MVNKDGMLPSGKPCIQTSTLQSFVYMAKFLADTQHTSAMIGVAVGVRRFVILDGADFLNEVCLDQLCTIFDRIQRPLLLVGLPQLLQRSLNHSHLYGRIGLTLRLVPLSYEACIRYAMQLQAPLRDSQTMKKARLKERRRQIAREEWHEYSHEVRQ